MRAFLAELPRTRTALAVALGVLALGSGLGLAALAAWLIARAWQMPPVLDLSIAVVAVRALGIARGLFRYLERLVTHDVALRSMSAARVQIYRDLADSPQSSRLRRGDVLTALGADVEALGELVVRAVVPIAVAVLLSICAVGLLSTISVAAAMVLACSLLLSGVLAPLLSARAAHTAERAAAEHRTAYAAHAVTALDHAAELRVVGKLDGVLESARAASWAAAAAEDRAARRSAVAAAALPAAVGIAVFGGLLSAVTTSGLTPPSLAVLVLLPLSAFEAVAALPAAAQALNRVRTRRAPEPTRPPRHWDIARPASRRVAVVGPSGIGKTTLLMQWAAHDDSALFFAEDAHLFDTTVLENLRVSNGKLTVTEAESVLRRVGLGEWLTRLPAGVHTHLIAGAAAVSGGQRRRILLARALVSPARVLLLDEPTEHLDAEKGARLLRELLDSGSGLVAADRSVVVVTHQLPDNHAADQVILLDGKSIAEFAMQS